MRLTHVHLAAWCLATSASLLLIVPGTHAQTTYDVGPGQPFASIGAVPLETLAAGDTVRIHWRAEPYREKWVVTAQGTATAPVTFVGVPGPGGALPIIDGENATTRLALSYWSEQRGVIKIGGSNTPSDVRPAYVVIENLDIRGARPPATFVDDAGAPQNYALNAAAIFVERGRHLIIRGCTIRDSGNGLFIASSDDEATEDVLIEGNYIVGNGNVGRIYEHNTYTAALGITYQYNRFGPLASGAGGNNLKDRSAGLVVRCNWIEGGNRQLDLVDGEDSSQIRLSPAYRTTFVYGNVLIEPGDDGNRQILHYGGDSGATADYRKGTLYFYHNTVVSMRAGRTTLMRLSTNDETCAARNNVVYVTAVGSELSLLDDAGTLAIRRNWFKPGWVNSFAGGSFVGNVTNDGTSILGATPSFADFAGQDFRLALDSDCLNNAIALPVGAANYPISDEYVPHQAGTPRPLIGPAPDLGAFETSAVPHFDFDLSGAVNIVDAQALAACLAGPALAPAGSTIPSAAGCLATFDADEDGDVDLADLRGFQATFAG